ncbi:MAG TPA: PAS domain-containing protein [Dongiaceae bacterium]|nr:PAS domain-containing protein [Dongiaceae bacterium]
MPLISADDDNTAIFEGLPADLRALFDYWRAKRAGRRMPSRSDLDPSELKTLLPSMILVDVLYDVAGKPDFVYRLAGTREVEVRGENPTGKRVAEAFFGPSLENVLGCYQSVVERGEPYLDDDYFLRDGDYFADEANIFLPLSNDGERVSMILVYTAYRRVR